MFVQPRAVLIFNNHMFVILIAMNEEPGTEHIKSASIIHGNNKAKQIAGIVMVGAIVTVALLLSGLSLIGSYQSAIAQEETTAGTTGRGATTDNATTTMGGTAEGGNVTTNATTTDAAEGNQSQIRMHIEEALTALQNNDTQGAIMQLDLALNALGSGTAVTTEGNDKEQEVSECGGVTVGGTSAADDYGCPPDPDY